jgi:multidrug efflux system outer membrane protein
MQRMVRSAICLVTLLAIGCALTPDYERPELDVPGGWVQPAPAGDSIANLPWWELFRDRMLRTHIENALAENKDLAISLARIREAREAVTITRADQFPFLDVFASAGRGRQSRVIVPGAATRDNYRVAGDLSFEIDLWRKFSRATEASRADLLSTEAAHRNVTISLVAEVATGYFLLRDLDARLAISERTVEGRRGSLEIIRARFEKGIVSELDVNQAEIELAIAEAAVASFERAVAQTEHGLRILLGRNPGPIPRGLSLEAQALPPEVPAGLPSELLQRRPDVVAAEERLAAETARIGVAEALRYPSFTLTGTLGLISDELSELNSGEAKAWDAAAGIFQPLFNSGRLKAQAQAQRARTEQALKDYEATLQQAFREVEDALVSVRTYRAEHAARRRQVTAARQAARLSRARYDGGVVDYLEVLDTERTLFNSELDESATLQQALASVVQLYKALGGGWTPSATPVPLP